MFFFFQFLVELPKQVTLAIIKPDAVKAGLVDEIIQKVTILQIIYLLNFPSRHYLASSLIMTLLYIFFWKMFCVNLIISYSLVYA